MQLNLFNLFFDLYLLFIKSCAQTAKKVEIFHVDCVASKMVRNCLARMNMMKHNHVIQRDKLPWKF